MKEKGSPCISGVFHSLLTFSAHKAMYIDLVCIKCLETGFLLEASAEPAYEGRDVRITRVEIARERVIHLTLFCYLKISINWPRN